MPGEPISVIIPVFNGETYLAAAIESVLGQNLSPAEIIVVDDGSYDQTQSVLRGFRDHIKTVHQTNRGPAAARNAGLDIATGEMIAFIDADDLWPRDHLRRLLECLHKSLNIGVSLGRLQHIDAASSLDRMSFLDEPVSLISHVSAWAA